MIATIVPFHIGFIPDGSRRAADREDCPLEVIYKRGADKGLEVVGWCRELGVRHWSGFGISHQNLQSRSTQELDAIRQGVLHFCQRVAGINGVSLHLFGDIDAMKGKITEKRELLLLRRGARTSSDLTVHVGINYSGTEEVELAPLFRAISRKGLGVVRENPRKHLQSAGVPNVDLVIRTGGRRRLSGFLPFQSATAELYFLDALWNDFTAEMLRTALDWFTKQRRTRGA